MFTIVIMLEKVSYILATYNTWKIDRYLYDEIDYCIVNISLSFLNIIRHNRNSCL